MTVPLFNEDGSYCISTILGPDGSVATIQNVTSKHRLCLPPNPTLGRFRPEPVRIDIERLAELGRVSMGLVGPMTTRMPSASGIFEHQPYFGSSVISTYASGKVVQIGCASVEQALLSALQHTETLNRGFGLNLIMTDFCVSNVVCSVKTGFPTNLLALKRLLGSRCSYEDPAYARRVHGKKEYSGARVRSKFTRVGDKKTPKMTVFGAGNANFIGCRDRKEIEWMCRELLEYLTMVEQDGKAIVPCGPSLQPSFFTDALRPEDMFPLFDESEEDDKGKEGEDEEEDDMMMLAFLRGNWDAIVD